MTSKLVDEKIDNKAFIPPITNDILNILLNVNKREIAILFSFKLPALTLEFYIFINKADCSVVKNMLFLTMHSHQSQNDSQRH
jgi:hypothetical protein